MTGRAGGAGRPNAETTPKAAATRGKFPIPTNHDLAEMGIKGTEPHGARTGRVAGVSAGSWGVTRPTTAAGHAGGTIVGRDLRLMGPHT